MGGSCGLSVLLPSSQVQCWAEPLSPLLPPTLVSPQGHKGDQEMQPLPNAGPSSPWLLAHVMVPSHAYEMTFAFSDQHGKVWDSNGSANYYSRISLRSSAGGPEHHHQNLPDEEEVAEEAAVVTLEELFSQSRERKRLFFTYPERLETGMHFQIYLNRRRSDVFRNSPNCKLTYGWNDWEVRAWQLRE
jgi:hypothetical protein